MLELKYRDLLGRLYNPSLPGIYYHLLYIGFSLMLGMSLSTSFLPLLAENLDPGGVLVGLVVSAWYFSSLFIELPAGIISDRMGRGRLLKLGLGVAMLGPIMCSRANHITILIIGRAVWGMGAALFFMSNMALLMDILPASTRGTSLGVFQGIEFIGSFIGAPIGAWLATLFSYTQVFYFTTFFMAVSLLISLRSEDLTAFDRRGGAVKELDLKRIISSLGNRDILLLCICNFFRMFIRNGIHMTVLPLYLNIFLGISLMDIGWIMSTRMLGMVPFLLAAGNISDRYGRKIVLGAGFIISALHLFMFSQVKSLPLLLLAGFIGGVGDGFGMNALMALLTDITPPEVRGGVVGLFRSFMDLGGFIGPVFFMLIYADLSKVMVFYAGLGMFLLCVIFVALIREGTVY